MSKKLYIKYMVSHRCKLLVEEELKKLGLSPASIDLGMVVLSRHITQQEQEALKTALLRSGLELMADKDQLLIEQAKKRIIEIIFYSDEMPELNFSDHLSAELKCDYAHLSKIFSEVKGITIKQFIIRNKIEKAKELLIYDQLSLTEVSYRLKYSSVGHLSNQFKKVTGHPASFFKEIQRISAKNKMNAGII